MTRPSSAAVLRPLSIAACQRSHAADGAGVSASHAAASLAAASHSRRCGVQKPFWRSKAISCAGACSEACSGSTMSPAERSSSCEPTSQLVMTSRSLRLSESWRSGVSTQGRAPGAIPTSKASVTDAGSSRPTLSSTPPSLMRCSHGCVHHSASVAAPAQPPPPASAAGGSSGCSGSRQRGRRRTTGSAVWSILMFSRRPPRAWCMSRERKRHLASRRPTTSRYSSSTLSSYSRRQPSRAARRSASAFELTTAVHGRHSPCTVAESGLPGTSGTSTRSSAGWVAHRPTDSSSSEQRKPPLRSELGRCSLRRKWVWPYSFLALSVKWWSLAVKSRSTSSPPSAWERGAGVGGVVQEWATRSGCTGQCRYTE